MEVLPVVKLKLVAGDSLRFHVAAFVVGEAWLPAFRVPEGTREHSNGDLSLSAPSRLNSHRFSWT